MRSGSSAKGCDHRSNNDAVSEGYADGVEVTGDDCAYGNQYEGKGPAEFGKNFLNRALLEKVGYLLEENGRKLSLCSGMKRVERESSPTTLALYEESSLVGGERYRIAAAPRCSATALDAGCAGRQRRPSPQDCDRLDALLEHQRWDGFYLGQC